jgi:DNA-binding response OmpR family regulator
MTRRAPTTPPTNKQKAILPINGRRTRPSPPNVSAGGRGDLPSPVVLVVSKDSLLRWAVYEALTAAQFRVFTSDEAHAYEILPKIDGDLALAIIDDEAWPMTRSERDWLHARWPRLPIVVLAHPGQGLEHRVKELGLADVLLKPFDVAHFVQTVERLVGPPTGNAHNAEHAATA